MKTNTELILRTIAGENVLVPIGEMADRINGLITLNSVAEFVWRQINTASDREEIIQLVLDEFDIDEETARRDVNGLLDELILLNMITE